MQKRAARVGLDRPSQIVIRELESAILATQSPARSGQDNELDEVNQSPNRHGRAGANARDFGESSLAQRSRRQSPGHGAFKGPIVGNGGNHDGSDQQTENFGEDDDESDNVVTGHRVHSLNITPASSDYEDEIVYE